MKTKWSHGSQAYIEALKDLGKALRHATLAKSRDREKIHAFGAELIKGANIALKCKGGDATLSTVPNLIFKAQLDKGLPKEGSAEVVIGGVSRFSEGVLSEQAINLLVLFTPTSNVGPLVADRTYVVRKIHFDLDRNNAGTARPTSHIQVGGKISETMLAHNRDPEGVEREIFNQIDIPRIPSPPYGLASVIDLALREFAPPSLQTLTGERPWNELVSRTETVLLSNYHARLHEQFESRDTRTNYSYHCDEVICEM